MINIIDEAKSWLFNHYAPMTINQTDWGYITDRILANIAANIYCIDHSKVVIQYHFPTNIQPIDIHELNWYLRFPII